MPVFMNNLTDWSQPMPGLDVEMGKQRKKKELSAQPQFQQEPVPETGEGFGLLGKIGGAAYDAGKSVYENVGQPVNKALQSAVPAMGRFLIGEQGMEALHPPQPQPQPTLAAPQPSLSSAPTGGIVGAATPPDEDRQSRPPVGVGGAGTAGVRPPTPSGAGPLALHPRSQGFNEIDLRQKFDQGIGRASTPRDPDFNSLMNFGIGQAMQDESLGRANWQRREDLGAADTYLKDWLMAAQGGQELGRGVREFGEHPQDRAASMIKDLSTAVYNIPYGPERDNMLRILQYWSTQLVPGGALPPPTATGQGAGKAPVAPPQGPEQSWWESATRAAAPAGASVLAGMKVPGPWPVKAGGALAAGLGGDWLLNRLFPSGESPNLAGQAIGIGLGALGGYKGGKALSKMTARGTPPSGGGGGGGSAANPVPPLIPAGPPVTPPPVTPEGQFEFPGFGAIGTRPPPTTGGVGATAPLPPMPPTGGGEGQMQLFPFGGPSPRFPAGRTGLGQWGTSGLGASPGGAPPAGGEASSGKGFGAVGVAKTPKQKASGQADKDKPFTTPESSASKRSKAAPVMTRTQANKLKEWLSGTQESTLPTETTPQVSGAMSTPPVLPVPGVSGAQAISGAVHPGAWPKGTEAWATSMEGAKGFAEPTPAQVEAAMRRLGVTPPEPLAPSALGGQAVAGVRSPMTPEQAAKLKETLGKLGTSSPAPKKPKK